MIDDVGSRLILKEQEELHQWARTVTQIYYTWYTTFLTVSGIALAWAFKNDSGEMRMLPLGWGVVTFFMLSFLGVFASAALVLYARQVDSRVKKINGLLLGDGDLAVKSPVPVWLAELCYALTGFALFVLTIIWGILFFELPAFPASNIVVLNGNWTGYENFETAFALDPMCKGVTLTLKSSSPSPWQLVIDHLPDEERHSWRLSPQSRKEIYEGSGDAKAAAHSVCFIVSRHGGSATPWTE